MTGLASEPNGETVAVAVAVGVAASGDPQLPRDDSAPGNAAANETVPRTLPPSVVDLGTIPRSASNEVLPSPNLRRARRTSRPPTLENYKTTLREAQSLRLASANAGAGGEAGAEAETERVRLKPVSRGDEPAGKPSRVE